MLSLSGRQMWAQLALLLLSVQGSFGEDRRHYSAQTNDSLHDPTHDPTHLCTSNVTVIDTTTVFSATTVPTTHYVHVTYYENVTLSSTETDVFSTCITESTTTTLHFTVSDTETDSTTTTLHFTVLDTETDEATITQSTTTTLHFTVSTTETDSATITETQTLQATITETTTATVPATVTTYTTTTIISTSVDPCPTECSISAATVNLFFWPTDRPYTYPSTYVDTNLAYTFTSPSVYMYIPTAKGTNSLGPMGPATSNWMLPLNLFEVSTIIDGTITRQLTLSDLGTDCPQTAEPSAIATMVDARCDPILAAPKEVSSWAYPCNACGHFGLFDPPYAVPTVTGGFIPSTTPPAPSQTTSAAPTTAPPVGTLLIIYFLNGTPMATATIATTGISGTITSSVFASTTPSSSPTTSSAPPPPPPTTTPTAAPTTAPATTGSTSHQTVATVSSPSTVVTASAAKVQDGLVWLIASFLISALLL